MAKSNKSKWMIGLTGTALSAFVISQVGANQVKTNLGTPESIAAESMSKQEKELIKLDWSNFDINGVQVSKGVEQRDRQTRRT